MQARTVIKNVSLFMAGCIAFGVYHSQYYYAGNADMLRQGDTAHKEAMTNEIKLPAEMNRKGTNQNAAPMDENQIVVPMKNKGTNKIPEPMNKKGTNTISEPMNKKGTNKISEPMNKKGTDQTGHDSIEAVDDYFRFPCLKELSFTAVKPCVRTICGEEACNNTVNCTALPLNVANDRPICTYDPAKELIAKMIKAGWFENGKIKRVKAVLKANPEMVLVDIGCNVGIYTLPVAAMSRRVVCVDANYENIRLVLNTLTLGNLTENVTLVWNALSYERGVAKLDINKGNVGASYIRSHGFRSKRPQEVQSIKLDELQSLVKGKPVFMKMDIESYELNALQGGREFLKNIDVRYIQTEFHTPSIREEMSNLLHSFGYNGYRDIERRLKVDNITGYSDEDIYFIKN